MISDFLLSLRLVYQDLSFPSSCSDPSRLSFASRPLSSSFAAVRLAQEREIAKITSRRATREENQPATCHEMALDGTSSNCP